MTHDPMCDWWTEQCKIDCSEYGSYDPCPHDSCLCDLIAKVRDDTLDKACNAVAAVEVGGEHFWSVGFRDGIATAVTVIDALRGES